MDWNHDNGSYYQPKNSRFATASMSCGILSVITCFTGLTCIPLGSLGILFALLSRGKDRRFPSTSVAGIVVSLFGILIGAVLIFYAFKILFDPIFRATYIDPFYREIYGIDFEEFIQKYYQMFQ